MQNVTDRSRHERIVNIIFIALLGILNVIWVVATVTSGVTSHDQQFMRFLHDGDQSKIYVIFICGTLIFRTVSAMLFGYALWVMYKSMRLYYRNSGTSKGANPASFYSHMLVMVLYLVGRTCSTYAYGKAAWDNDLPEVLWLVSNCIA